MKNLKYIDENITEDFRKLLKTDSLPLTVATEIAHLDEEEQKELHNQTENIDSLGVEDVKQFKTKQVEKKIKTAVTLEYATYIVNTSLFDSVTDIIHRQYPVLKECVVLNKNDYAKVMDAQAIIGKQLEKIEKILIKTKEYYFFTLFQFLDWCVCDLKYKIRMMYYRP